MDLYFRLHLFLFPLTDWNVKDQGEGRKQAKREMWEQNGEQPDPIIPKK